MADLLGALLEGTADAVTGVGSRRRLYVWLVLAGSLIGIAIWSIVVIR